MNINHASAQVDTIAKIYKPATGIVDLPGLNQMPSLAEIELASFCMVGPGSDFLGRVVLDGADGRMVRA